MSIYAPRAGILLARLEQAGLPALLVTDLVNMRYLSGFNGSAGALLLTPGRQYILADFRYHERVRREADPLYELVDTSGLDLGRDVLAKLLPAGTHCGFEADHVNVTQLAQLQRGFGAELVATTGWVEDLRAVKDPAEVELIRLAVRLGELIYGELLPLIGPGTTEADLAAEIEYRARRYGAEACSFSPIIASGERSSQPHAGFSRAHLTPDAPLTIDMGVVLDGYCSDMTRTVFYKSCSPFWEGIYRIVNEAKDLAFAAIRPGVPASEVDAVARNYITEAGYGDAFRHGLGHGVGMPFKGAPRLNWTSTDILREGHVASDEPGIYLPGKGGIRIEDLFVVTAGGAENLNALGCELTVVA